MTIPFDELKASVALSAIVGQTLPLKRAGREFKALCPFHDEKTPSFTIDKDDQFFHCFGCGAHGDVFDWLKRRQGLDANEAAEFLGYKNGHPHKNGKVNTHSDTGWIAAPYPPIKAAEPDFKGFDHVYRYTDANGRVTRFIARKDATATEKKTFVPFTWGTLNGRVGWHHRHAEAPRGLYGLTHLDDAPDGLAVVCEGEKAADAAHELLKLPCLTWSGGTQSVHTADWRPLAGRDVVIWPDNDDPGHKAAEDIRLAIKDVARSVRVLPVKDLPKGFDAADLPSGTNERWFHDRLNGTKPPLPLVWFEEIQTDLSANDFVQGVLMETSSAVVYGKSNSGKTFWTTDLALHVAAGMEWQGRRVVGGGVVYCIMESGIGFKNRVAAWRTEKNLDGKSLPFAAIPAGLNLSGPEQPDVAGLIETVKSAGARVGQHVRLIVIDTLSRALAGGDENGPEDMGALVKAMDQIREATGSAVLFIHHSGKDEARGARGHSLLQAAIDTEIEVAVDDGGEVRTATVVKQREMSKGDQFTFSLKVVELGHNRYDEPVTTCVVVPGGTPTVPRVRLTGHNLRAFDILADLIARTGASGYAGVPPGCLSVPAKWWRDAFYERAIPGGEAEAKRKAFRRSADHLVEFNIVGMAEDRVWLVHKTDRDGNV